MKRYNGYSRLDPYDFDIIPSKGSNKRAATVAIKHLQSGDIAIISEDIYRHDDKVYLESTPYRVRDYSSTQKDEYITMYIDVVKE